MAGCHICSGRLGRLRYLWMCTSSAELETHSNGRVLGIGHVTVWTSHAYSVVW
jgi:hypothetical protein